MAGLCPTPAPRSLGGTQGGTPARPGDPWSNGETEARLTCRAREQGHPRRVVPETFPLSPWASPDAHPGPGLKNNPKRDTGGAGGPGGPRPRGEGRVKGAGGTRRGGRGAGGAGDNAARRASCIRRKANNSAAPTGEEPALGATCQNTSSKVVKLIQRASEGACESRLGPQSKGVNVPQYDRLVVRCDFKPIQDE